MVARKAEADDLADLRMEVSHSLELKADVVQVRGRRIMLICIIIRVPL
jgi:hypothetical protein